MKVEKFLISLAILISFLAIFGCIASSIAPNEPLSSNNNEIINPQVTYTKKVDCHPLSGASKERCEQLGCVWEEVHEQKRGRQTLYDSNMTYGPDIIPLPGIEEPWCHFPANYVGYTIERTSNTNDEITLVRQKPSGSPNDIERVQVSIIHLNKALRIRIWDPQERRFEPKLPKIRYPSEWGSIRNRLEGNHFKIDLNKRTGILQITRPSTGQLMFRTNLHQLIFSNRFIQLNTDLSSEIVYGLGEHLDNFAKRADEYRPYSFWATDKLELPGGRRSYGSFPFFINPELAPEQNGRHHHHHHGNSNQSSMKLMNAHGVYLRNSNAMDVILQPDKSVTFRPVGGILDFFILAGPSAQEVVQQYQQFVGLPELPPRWSLGFQLCRYNYSSLEKLKQVFERTRASGIPYDVQWTDIDYMQDGNDFTYDKVAYAGLPEFVDHLHSINMHYVPIFDPGLSQEANYEPYELGMQMDVFVKNASDQVLVGRVWNKSNRTVFPDFSSSRGRAYWSKLFQDFHKQLKFDGAWIDMNEISNFEDGSLDGCPYELPTPYHPGGYHLHTKTLCLDAKHEAGSEFDLHQLYAFYESIATRKAMMAVRPDKRTFIISRATSPGQGHYAGHWSGDILARWEYLKWTIPSSIEHSMYGFNMMGHDICGFTIDTTVELCARWQALGAFYTFSRNHNDDVSKDQDPAILGPDVLEATRNSLVKRYSLLPFLYNLIYRAHRFGEPAIRSTGMQWYESEPESIEAEDQMMWGDQMIISPVVEQGKTEKRTYLPKGYWYEFNVLPVPEDSIALPKRIDSQGEWVMTQNISIRDIPLFMRGGSIIPVYRKVSQTIPETEKQPFGLDIFPDKSIEAQGELFVDDGESLADRHDHLEMKFNQKQLHISMDRDGYLGQTELGQVIFYNLPYKVSSVKANERPITWKSGGPDTIVIDLNSWTISRKSPLLIELN